MKKGDFSILKLVKIFYKNFQSLLVINCRKNISLLILIGTEALV